MGKPDQAAIAAAGGCAPQVTNDYTNQSITLCAGGNLTITWTITDKCDTITVDAIYTVTPAPAVTFTEPADATLQLVRLPIRQRWMQR